MKDVKMSFWITPTQKKLIVKTAKEQKTTASAIVREMIDLYLKSPLNKGVGGVDKNAGHYEEEDVV